MIRRWHWLAALVVTAAAGSSFAAWALVGTGLPTPHSGAAANGSSHPSPKVAAGGSSSSDTAAPGVQMPITGAVGGLWPGASESLVLTISNPNPWAAQVDGLSVVAAGVGSCDAGNLQVGPFGGPLTVPADGSATTAFSISMAPTAPEACQGVSFPLTYRADAVRQ